MRAIVVGFEAEARKCDACGHEWLGLEESRRCAKCKTVKWDRGGALPDRPAVEAAVVVQVQAPNGETAICKRCDGVVYRDPPNPRYWKCPKGRCGRQLDESEVRR